jgi:two-component system, NarL family, nitrate/nitrite response regulator NarL
VLVTLSPTERCHKPPAPDRWGERLARQGRGARQRRRAPRVRNTSAHAGIAWPGYASAALGVDTAITVLILADIALHGEGLQRSLGEDSRFTVHRAVGFGGAGLGSTALPDVIVLDVEAPVASARSLRAVAPDTPIVVLAADRTDEQIISFAAAGINAYCPPEVSAIDLAVTLVWTARRESPCCHRIAGALMRKARSLAAEAPGPPLAELTPREREVVHLIGLALSNKQIAAQLHIALPTVKSHVHHILAKLDLSRRGEILTRTRALSDGSSPWVGVSV